MVHFCSFGIPHVWPQSQKDITPWISNFLLNHSDAFCEHINNLEVGIVRLVEIPIDGEKDMRLGRYGQGKTGPLLVGINKKILVPGFQGENPAGP